MRGLKDQLIAAGYESPPPRLTRNAEGDALRSIVKVIDDFSPFGASLVHLECGHSGYTFGTERAGCPACTIALQDGEKE